MFYHWIVNAGLLAVPIGATVGVLMGIDLHREATGQRPLFSTDVDSIGNGVSGGGDNNGGGSNSNNNGNNDGNTDNGSSNNGTSINRILDNNITSTLYCQKEFAVSPPANGSRYIFNPNQWGWKEGDKGALCMNVTTFNNETYATVDTAPDFSVTWQYPVGLSTAPVHAFPNVMVGSSALPVKLDDVEHINLGMQWSYGVGNKPAATTNVTALTKNLVNTNVAIDMFLDKDKKSSQNSTLAKYEFMVWFAVFGAGAVPIGLEEGIVSTQVLEGITFDLYTGQNSLKQTVLTWVAANTTEVFNGDISPLLTKLSSLDNDDVPEGSVYLGYLSLGSEAFSASANVTFSVPVFSVDIQS